MKEESGLSPAINVQQCNKPPAFYNCANCGRHIPPRRMTQKSLGKRDGVICKCGGKLFRFDNHPSDFRQIIHLIFHIGLIRQTIFCPKKWRVNING